MDLAAKRGLEEGLELGIERGLEQGLEKGLEQGIEKGIELGEKRKAFMIASQLLDLLDDETIAVKLGLSIDQVAELRETGL